MLEKDFYQAVRIPSAQLCKCRVCLGIGKSSEGQKQGIDGKVGKDELGKIDWGQMVQTLRVTPEWYLFFC